MKKATSFMLTQQKADGSLVDHNRPTAMTALAIIAMCSVGHLPTSQTTEGEAVRKALDYVLKPERQNAEGYFGIDGSRMYGHGIISLMLAEVVGMGVNEKQDQLVRERLTKAVALILWSQERKEPGHQHYGGWRYEPGSKDSDLSVSIWQLLTLRAAKNAGFTVPKKNIDAAVAYLKRSYHSKRNAAGQPLDLKSACAYQPGHGPNFPMAAAGLLALQICGEYAAPEVQGSANWLKEINPDINQKFFYYGIYYYAQAMYQRGGDDAEIARKKTTDILLQNQQPDGGWEARDSQEKDAGRVYATAMAMLSLSVQYHYLPIYQR